MRHVANRQTLGCGCCVPSPDVAHKLLEWEEKLCAASSERQPVCACFIEEIVPEQLLVHVKMQIPGSPPRAVSPGSLVLAEQANLPLNDLPVSFGHSSCSIDLLPETALCAESQQ